MYSDIYAVKIYLETVTKVGILTCKYIRARYFYMHIQKKIMAYTRRQPLLLHNHPYITSYKVKLAEISTTANGYVGVAVAALDVYFVDQCHFYTSS